MEHVAMVFEDVPVWLGDMIWGFLAIDSGSKVKWAMDKHILMCQINPFTKRK